MNCSKNKTLQNDNRHCFSFYFSVIFLNVLFYNQNDDDDDANATIDADNDGDDNDNADAKHDKYDSDETFLTEDTSRYGIYLLQVLMYDSD